jgi:sugar phosphate isomerase/epimerase
VSSMNQSLAEDIAMWQRLEVGHVGLILYKIEAIGFDAAAAMLREAGLAVSTIAGPVPVPLREPFDSDACAREAAVLGDAIDFAASVDAGSFYVCTGSADELTRAEAVRRFAERIAGPLTHASEVGVRLALEPTNPMRTDVSFVFGFGDAVEVAHTAGLAVIAEFQACWNEPGISELLRDHVSDVAVVQVSDYIAGSVESPDRAVPGDGVIPIAELVRSALGAGYDGPFDIEILGPRIEREGYEAAIARSVDAVSELLHRLDA